MILKGKIIIKLINKDSKDEHQQLFLQREDNNELIKIRKRDSNPFQNDEMLSKEGRFVEISGDFDEISGTFIFDDSILEEKW